MNFQVIKCPCCGAEGSLKQTGDVWFCAHCASKFTEDSAERAYKQLHDNMTSMLRGEIDDALREAKEEQYYNLRSNLWELISAKYTDSKAITEVCREIKMIEPHDFLAEFFTVANGADKAATVDYINGIDAYENGLYMDLVIGFMIRSLTDELVAPVNFLIERAYRNTDLEKFEKYITELETEAEKLEGGIYETALPRDVFIAYSSKDMPKVLELMTALEENGFSCFVAMRNLQHGRGAVENYEAALHEAMDNARMLVFVSSENSRSFSCDALKKELTYVKNKELLSAPPEYRNNYSALPDKYKKPRVEYRLDNKRTLAADIFMKEFFAGKDYCESIEKVIIRVMSIIVGGEMPDPEAEARAKVEANARQMEQLRAEIEAERRAREEAERAAAQAKATTVAAPKAAPAAKPAATAEKYVTLNMSDGSSIKFAELGRVTYSGALHAVMQPVNNRSDTRVYKMTPKDNGRYSYTLIKDQTVIKKVCESVGVKTPVATQSTAAKPATPPVMFPKKESIVTMYKQTGERVDFKEIAAVRYNGKVYALMQPTKLLPGMDKQEALVYRVSRMPDGSDNYEIVLDNATMDGVFKLYHQYAKK